MGKRQHINLSMFIRTILAAIFICIYVFSINVIALGDTIPLNNETTTYKFELGEKTTTNYEDYIENKNEQFAYGIMERSDLFVISICFLLIIVGLLLVKNNNDKKNPHKK